MKTYQLISLIIYIVILLISIFLFIDVYLTYRKMKKDFNNEEKNKKIYEEKNLKKKIWFLIALAFVMVGISLIDFIVRLI